MDKIGREFAFGRFTTILFVLCLCLTMSASLTEAKKKNKKKIELPNVKVIAVLPFHYIPQPCFIKTSDKVAAIGFRAGLVKKSDFSYVEMKEVFALCEEQGLNTTKPITDKKATELGKLLKADAVLVGKLSSYDEREEEGSVIAGRAGSVETENTRDVKATFDVRFVFTSTGEATEELSFTKKNRDSRKAPMQPASPEILLERCAKSAAKKLKKRLK